MPSSRSPNVSFRKLWSCWSEIFYRPGAHTVAELRLSKYWRICLTHQRHNVSLLTSQCYLRHLVTTIFDKNRIHKVWMKMISKFYHSTTHTNTQIQTHSLAHADDNFITDLHTRHESVASIQQWQVTVVTCCQRSWLHRCSRRLRDVVPSHRDQLHRREDRLELHTTNKQHKHLCPLIKLTDVCIFIHSFHAAVHKCIMQQL